MSNPIGYTGGTLVAKTPITGETVAHVREVDAAGATSTIEKAHAAFLEWRLIPSPKRGELVRLLGEELRTNKRALGRLVSIEAGKIESEGLGEVQEMIDICDFAVGLSRQLYGLTIATERHEHRMAETWHPLGVTGIISAFNFPVAVWSWNAALALVCGNSVVWKPSEKTPLTALGDGRAVRTRAEALQGRWRLAPDGLSAVLIGGREIGEALVDNPRVPLVSATGSTAMGRAVAPKLAQRFARAILELGGNNAAVVTPTADLDLTLRGVAFAAMGTAGQRCTTLRRLFVHESVYDSFVPRLKKVYASVSVGNPLSRQSGRPADRRPRLRGDAARDRRGQGRGRCHCRRRARRRRRRGMRLSMSARRWSRSADRSDRSSARPSRRSSMSSDISDFDAVIELHNAVPQGLSSSIFTNDLREAEAFLSARGSDCGIANVNIGPSGAEIGGAFGGEKETGGGRESGSDAWKAYMRRATNTINYGRTLPLAQGVRFDVD